MHFLLAIAVLLLGQGSDTELRSDWAVVFPESSAGTLLKQCTRRLTPRADQFWVPDAKTIRQLERVLRPALQQALDRQFEARHRKPAAEYYRQYGGIVIGGRRVVYVNGFHKLHLQMFNEAYPDRRPTWRKQAVNVCDGGSLFFGAEYDVATGTIGTIQFNRD